MKLSKIILAPTVMLALIAVPAVAAAQAVILQGDVKVEKTVVEADGEQRKELVDPDVIVPGDRLVMGTDYRNNGVEPVANFVVTNPLPAAVRLAPDADPALIVSVDGGSNWGPLSSLTVATEDGGTRPAQHSDVTHVRWTLARIEPGASGRLEYPAIIR